jgi:hypothetical protein
MACLTLTIKARLMFFFAENTIDSLPAECWCAYFFWFSGTSIFASRYSPCNWWAFARPQISGRLG